MPQSLALEEVAAAARSFAVRLAKLRPQRIEATVAGAAGMPVLCAVEAVLREALSGRAAQELVWLTSGPTAGVHRLRLIAYGADDAPLAEAAHEFAL